MQENGFWDDVKRAEEVTKECNIIKDKIERYENLVSRIDDVEVLAELAQEDEDTVNEVIQEIRSIEKEVESYRVELLLSGEYDRNNAILNLHAGVGGADANDWTEMLLRMYTRWCDKKGYKVETLDLLEGDEAGIKSVTLKRRKDHDKFIIRDEYDVQDLLHALLKLHFSDVRPEEWTPSYAGNSNRMDFLLKEAHIAIEIKMTRDNLKDKEIGEQLIIDIAKYQQHPDVDMLYCFVYDPNTILHNPVGLENDLNKLSTDNFSVKVFVRPN